MKMIVRLVAGFALASAGLATTAQAAPITSLPGGSAVTIPPSNSFTGGPVAFGPGIVYTATNSTAVFGWTNSYGFSSNGGWSGTPMIGLNTDAGSFTLTFAAPISAFLAEMNWTTDNAALNGSIAAYDGLGNLIESLTLENGSNAVPVGFHGFSEATANIASIRFNNEYIGIRNISVATNAVAGVPEPATWAMMMLGFGSMGFALRRTRKATARIRFA